MNESKQSSEFSLLERRFADSFIMGLLDVSFKVDKFSTWALGVVSATVVLVISNLDSVGGQLSEGFIKAIFSLSAISILFGLAQKVRYFKIMVSVGINNSIQARLKGTIQELTGQDNPDTFKYIQENMDVVKGFMCIVSGFPYFLRKIVVRQFIASLGEPLDMAKHNNSVLSMMFQMMYTSLQMVSAVCIVPLVAIGI